MAATPTTSALGTVADIGRSVSAGPAAPDTGSSNKSSFSTVLEGAQDCSAASAASSKPTAEATDTDQVASDIPIKTALDMQLLLGGKLMKTTVTGGKVLPPNGDTLPVTTALPMDMLGVTTASIEPGSSSPRPASKSAGSEDESAATVTTSQPVLAPFLPENPVTSTAGLVPRAPVATAGSDGDAANSIADATTSPKREVPTPPPALTAAAVSAEPQPAIVAMNAAADSAVDAAANVAPAIAAEADVAPTADVLLSRMTGKPRVASAAMSAAAPANAIATDAATGDTPQQNVDALVAGAKSAGNTERAEFRDALKQVDATLVAAPAAPERNESAAATRDTGLRQYIDASAATTARVDVPVGKPGWGDAVSDKVMWMSAQNINSAEIQLNPPDLGPLTVRVSSHHDQTSVFFTSTHAVVREALDQSLPRLREMLDGQGIQLLDVGVGDQGGARQQTARGENFTSGGNRGETDDMDAIGEINSVTARSKATTQRAGLLDAYA